jgi:hypothetical protein
MLHSQFLRMVGSGTCFCYWRYGTLAWKKLTTWYHYSIYCDTTVSSHETYVEINVAVTVAVFVGDFVVFAVICVVASVS